MGTPLSFGEPGIGKTRLTIELTDLATARGQLCCKFGATRGGALL